MALHAGMPRPRGRVATRWQPGATIGPYLTWYLDDHLASPRPSRPRGEVAVLHLPGVIHDEVGGEIVPPMCRQALLGEHDLERGPDLDPARELPGLSAVHMPDDLLTAAPTALRLHVTQRSALLAS